MKAFIGQPKFRRISNKTNGSIFERFLEAEEKPTKAHRQKNEWKKTVKNWCFIKTHMKQQ
jgi:hypothetical protein